MKCYLCGKELEGDSLGTCSECRKKKDLEREVEQAVIEESRPSRIVHEENESSLKTFLSYFLPAMGIVFAYLGYTLLSPPKKIQLVSIESNMPGDPCSGKEKCLICYVAPWCPACKSAVPAIQAIRDHYYQSPALGMKVVVGADEMPALEQYGREIGGQIFFDPDSSYKNGIKAWSIPYLILIDSENRPLSYTSGMPASGDRAQIVGWARKKLNLPEA